ncbi:transposase [Actinocrispum wychmicini]|uniref:Putative transposase of IS4/5 family DUF4096 n=1 Tax=Actinocrispum wychmicini TaxID=1213861 RepID=A0A4R2JXZ1_9PSEU|nr:putative transposase of IS4/5 family DUF4096 [Actinocrispum wychmicini]
MNGHVLLFERLVPDQLWARVGPMLPSTRARPQGGGRARTDDRAVFTAVVYVLGSGCGWRQLPRWFGVSAPTAHRRFIEWTAVDIWSRIEHTVADGMSCEDTWLRAIVDAAKERACN